jgi:hypothetical protein
LGHCRWCVDRYTINPIYYSCRLLAYCSEHAAREGWDIGN